MERKKKQRKVQEKEELRTTDMVARVGRDDEKGEEREPSPEVRGKEERAKRERKVHQEEKRTSNQASVRWSKKSKFEIEKNKKQAPKT